MQITTEQIKALRDLTGAGIMDSKKALEEAEGDIEKAESLLKAKGIEKLASKSHRETSEGLIESYVHSGSRIGALVEVNCETDFVSRTPEFKDLAHNLSMQVAAMAPLYKDKSELPADDTSNPEEVCLLQQPFIRDNSRTIQDIVTEVAAKVGENVRIKRFARFSLGE